MLALIDHRHLKPVGLLLFNASPHPRPARSPGCAQRHYNAPPRIASGATSVRAPAARSQTSTDAWDALSRALCPVSRRHRAAQSTASRRASPNPPGQVARIPPVRGAHRARAELGPSLPARTQYQVPPRQRDPSSRPRPGARCTSIPHCWPPGWRCRGRMRRSGKREREQPRTPRDVESYWPNSGTAAHQVCRPFPHLKE